MAINRIYNFGSGPGMMPAEVLQQAQAELLSWQQRGISVWEMPFTGETFQTIAEQAKQDLRELLAIPPQYRILFMQGGASAQFSLVPMNLLGGKRRADYVETGHWSSKAIIEGQRYCRVSVAASGVDTAFSVIPPRRDWQLDPAAAYCHITSNETANGVQYSEIPDIGKVPLVADMTSDFLSRPIDFDRVDLIYAGAQKNIGPAGLTIVVIREDLIQPPMPTTPSAFSYKVVNETHGRFNTPLTYAIYLAGLVFKHLKQIGGLSRVSRFNQQKSVRLYRAIDSSDFYHCPVALAYRSKMNICFTLADPTLDNLFLARAEEQGLLNLRGHPAMGGVRASLYNAMPDVGVAALEQFMAEFASRYG
ncbi:MAG: 3-phosphoserine/phosphohydroxythreonine transaminase [Amphritea sp.]